MIVRISEIPSGPPKEKQDDKNVNVWPKNKIVRALYAHMHSQGGGWRLANNVKLIPNGIESPNYRTIV